MCLCSVAWRTLLRLPTPAVLARRAVHSELRRCCAQRWRERWDGALRCGAAQLSALDTCEGADAGLVPTKLVQLPRKVLKRSSLLLSVGCCIWSLRTDTLLWLVLAYVESAPETALVLVSNHVLQT